MFHILDPDSPDWRCVTCDATWSGAVAFMTDPRDCEPAWADRDAANLHAPLVWEGVSA